jgi:hypothetical protein
VTSLNAFSSPVDRQRFNAKLALCGPGLEPDQAAWFRRSALRTFVGEDLAWANDRIAELERCATAPPQATPEPMSAPAAAPMRKTREKRPKATDKPIDVEPIKSRRLKQALNLLHVRRERTLPDNKRGRAILETLISLGLTKQRAEVFANWMPDGYHDAVKRDPKPVAAKAVGEALELVWNEVTHPWVLAFHIEAIDETPELRAAWRRKRYLMRQQQYNGKRLRKRKVPTSAPDKLAPRAKIVLGAAEREWIAILEIAKKVRAANEFRRKGARSKPSSETIQRAVRRIVDDLIAAEWLQERVDVKGSIMVRHVRLAPLRSHQGGGRAADKKATTGDPIAADKMAYDA